MKKRLVQALLLSAMMVSLSAYSVASNWRHMDNNETDVAAQTETTKPITVSNQLNVLTDIGIISADISKENMRNNLMANEFYIGWTVGNVNVRKNPSLNSQIINTLPFNTPVEYYKFNEEWVKVFSQDGIGYIHTDCLSEIEYVYTDYSICDRRGFKSYMPYTSITSKSSLQYKLQQISYTGNYGIRQCEGRFCVAIGTAFGTEIGTYFDLILENGEVIPCVVSDFKADIHTDSKNITTVANGCVSEFIVDSQELYSKAKQIGNISYCNNWNSKVEKIRVYEKNVFIE